MGAARKAAPATLGAVLETGYIRAIEAHSKAPSKAPSRETVKERAAPASGGEARSPVGSILALQRLAGNAAVSQLLATAGKGPNVQRQTPGTTGGAAAGKFDPSMIKLTNANPTFTGNVKASAQGSNVQLDAPEISIDATATIDVAPGTAGWDALGVGPRIDIGPTQSLLGSTRSGVYHVGGDPSGAVVGEEKSAVRGPVRDATTDPKSKKVAPDVVAPWYALPHAFNDADRSGTIRYFDQPGAPFPIKLNEGVLTETKGEDRFITSIAAKSDTLPLTHLHQYEWAVPWQMQIDHSGSGAGLAASGHETKAVPPTLDGPIAAEKDETWVAFNSVADAVKQPTEILLRYLAPAKNNDPAAYATILAALKQKKSMMTITVTVEQTDNVTFNDDVVVRVGEVEQKIGSLGNGQFGSASFDLWQIFLDPGRIDTTSVVVVKVIHSGVVSDEAARLPISYPFPPGGPINLRVGSGRYNASWTWT